LVSGFSPSLLSNLLGGKIWHLIVWWWMW
jgi:hypothetical protein